jgi:Holliday junction resolvase
VDVETQGQGGRYAIEVKTTRGQQVRLDEGNIRSLRDRLGDDYVPSVAILRLVPLENWLVASIPLRELAVGTYPVERFRASRIPELEAAINDHFDTIVARNFAGIQRQGLSFLDDLLRRAGAEVEDTPQCESPIRTQD